jgi:hypothetical protein
VDTASVAVSCMGKSAKTRAKKWNIGKLNITARDKISGKI